MELGDNIAVRRMSSETFAAFVQPSLESGTLAADELDWIKFTRRRIRNRELAALNRYNRRLRDQQIADELASLYDIIAGLNQEIELLRDLHRRPLFCIS